MIVIINNEKFNVDIANSFKSKLIGLMGKKNIQKGIIFFNTGSIHTFFMKENIDILMLTKEKRIIYIKKDLMKNKIIIKPKAKYTIELPKNSIKNIQLNDLVIFEE